MSAPGSAVSLSISRDRPSRQPGIAAPAKVNALPARWRHAPSTECRCGAPRGRRTDGCLGGRTITFTNKDRQLVETFVECVGQPVKIGVQFKPHWQPAYRAQLGNRALFKWLISIGVTPRQSLTIGAIAVPDAFFLAVARGLLDGDGSVRNYWYTVPKGTRPYEALVVVFHSASRPHLGWLQRELTRLHAFSWRLVPEDPAPA